MWPDGEVDLSLRIRSPTTRLERVQQQCLFAVDEWCSAYEAEIAELGGIGPAAGDPRAAWQRAPRP